LVVQYYLVVYERQPLKFELAFYKPKDEWVFQKAQYGFQGAELPKEKKTIS
jgi:hypothetical protein